MGCDGGTIPTRDELVRVKKKPEQKDKNVDLSAKWDHCAISQQSLEKPIVACQLGRLYNKDSVIELLLDRSKFEGAADFDHLKTLKDVRELNLTSNAAYTSAADKGDSYKDFHMGRFICSITGLEMTGRYRFSYMIGCGCVFSERALKEVQATTCHNCGKEYTSSDVIVMNGTDEDVDEMRSRMEQRKIKAKLDKKKAKKKKLEEAAANEDPSAPKKVKFAAKDKEHMIPKIGKKAKLPSSSNGAGGTQPEEKKAKNIQSDPKASAAYKSLFTSSDKCKNQMKAHWVTHNPGYY